MRIAISGSSNCGKTSLADALGTALGVEVVSEFFGEPFPESPQLSQAQEMYRFETIYEAKSRHEDHLAQGFISDRSPIDLAYSWLIRALPLNHPAPSRAFLSRCRARAQVYDAVIFPPGPSPETGAANYFGRPDRVWEMWRNHNAMLGLALRWLPAGRLVLIPEELGTLEAWVEWLLEHCAACTKGAS